MPGRFWDSPEARAVTKSEHLSDPYYALYTRALILSVFIQPYCKEAVLGGLDLTPEIPSNPYNSVTVLKEFSAWNRSGHLKSTPVHQPDPLSPNTQPEPSLAPPEATSCPSSCQLRKGDLHLLVATFFQVITEHSEVSPQPPFLQTEQPHFHQAERPSSTEPMSSDKKSGVLLTQGTPPCQKWSRISHVQSIFLNNPQISFIFLFLLPGWKGTVIHPAIPSLVPRQ